MSKKTFPKSQGPKGDLDPRRWVIMTIRNSGASEAQFPLPVTHNTQRIAFDRDEPVVAPAYYVDVINDCILPKYEKVRQSTDAYSGQGNGGQLENKDESRMVEIKYAVDIEEIDAKYQTVDTIIEFVKMVNSDDCPPELSAYQGELRLGQMSFNNNNYAWSELNKGRKKEVKKVATANS